MKEFQNRKGEIVLTKTGQLKHTKDAKKEVKMKKEIETETETIKFTYDEYELCSEQNEKDHNCSYACYELGKDNCGHDFKEAEINKGIVYGYETISDLVLDTTDTDTITFITNFTKGVELEAESNDKNSYWHDTTLEYKNGEFGETSTYINKEDKKLLTLTKDELSLLKDLVNLDGEEKDIDERIQDLENMNFETVDTRFDVFYAFNLLRNGAPTEFINEDAINKLLLKEIQKAAEKRG